MSERGTIINVARKQQINDFSRLKFGNITPTDIDGLIEYKNLAYVFLEVKYGNAPFPDGQRIALERLSNDVDLAGKKSIVIIGQHEISNTSESVDAAICWVRKYFYKGSWRLPKSPITVIEAIIAFLELEKIKI
jgi:hypothetical protein